MQVWNTPFSKERFPSLSFIDNQDVGQVEIVVRAGGAKSNATYHVRFNLLVAIRIYEEGMEPENFSKPVFSHESCAYMSAESSWKGEFEFNAGFIESSFGKSFSELQHFVILGGDWVVEVLAHMPEIHEA